MYGSVDVSHLRIRRALIDCKNDDERNMDLLCGADLVVDLEGSEFFVDLEDE
jgi:hypothetical protein